MRIRGAIFDADGTLLDSMFIWDTIGETYLRSIGYEPRENLNEVFKNMSLLQAARYYQTEYGVTLCVDEIINGVNAMLERCGALSCFGRIFTCGEVGHGKDEPHIFEEALRFLGTKKSETVVFDDALYAVRTAKEAGFPVAAVYDIHEKAQNDIRELSAIYLEDLAQLDKLQKHLSV
ncbi:MAG: HAD family hydrolase [Lachnospiraceae bacterium]|jgi:beta-phosphoglucomutase-like phosphatase (HAD superfamily)|nr:HAD family hydrolase [Lachnospiraceae bacterium]